MFTVTNGDERVAECSCCNRPVYKGLGELQSSEALLAEYAYRWPEGHEGKFTLAIRIYDKEGNPAKGVAVLRGWKENGGVAFSVLDPEDSPWQDFGTAGPVLRREQVLLPSFKTRLFEFADEIVRDDDRLSRRLAACE